LAFHCDTPFWHSLINCEVEKCPEKSGDVTISENVASVLKTEYLLDYDSDPNSLEVRINGAISTDYVLEGRKIRFINAPPLSATITVSYTVGATVVKSDFSLSETPADGTLEVLVNGNVAAANSYSLNKASKTITFNQTPADSASITFNYKREGPMLNSFTLAGNKNINESSVVTKVNGASVAFSLNKATRTVTLNQTPPDGANIAISFTGDPILSYPIALVGSKQENLKARVRSTGSEINITLVNGSIQVRPEDFKNGETVDITYLNPDSAVKKIVLPYAPITESIELLGIENDCKIGNGLRVVNQKELVIDCDLSNEPKLSVRFNHSLKENRSFTLGTVENPDKGEWLVKVDGQPTKAYTRSGRTITLSGSQDLSNSSDVKIEYSSLGF
jgi:hypothetical protein